MQRRMTRRASLAALLVALAAVAALLYLYQHLHQPPEAATGTPARLRVGLLPVIDALPFVVAESEGLFSAEGVNVELIYFGSARDRDAAIMTGQVDVAVHDPVGALLLISRGAPIKIVAFVCCLRDEDANVGFYYVRAPGAREVRTVAISRGTIIEYVASKLVAGNVTFVDTPSILNRFQLVIEGRVDAAVLPDPWGTLALAKNATLLARHRDLVVLVARAELLETREGRRALERLARALNEAVDAYSANPDKYWSLVAERLNVPRELKGAYRAVWRARVAEVPRELFESVAAWLRERGLVERQLKYEECVG